MKKDSSSKKKRLAESDSGSESEDESDEEWDVHEEIRLQKELRTKTGSSSGRLGKGGTGGPSGKRGSDGEGGKGGGGKKRAAKGKGNGDDDAISDSEDDDDTMVVEDDVVLEGDDDEEDGAGVENQGSGGEGSERGRLGKDKGAEMWEFVLPDFPREANAACWSDSGFIAVNAGTDVIIVDPAEGVKTTIQSTPDLEQRNIPAVVKHEQCTFATRLLMDLGRVGDTASLATSSAWSPAGAAPDGGCALVACWADGTVTIFCPPAHTQSPEWNPALAMSDLVYKACKDVGFGAEGEGIPQVDGGEDVWRSIPHAEGEGGEEGVARRGRRGGGHGEEVAEAGGSAKGEKGGVDEQEAAIREENAAVSGAKKGREVQKEGSREAKVGSSGGRGGRDGLDDRCNENELAKDVEEGKGKETAEGNDKDEAKDSGDCNGTGDGTVGGECGGRNVPKQRLSSRARRAPSKFDDEITPADAERRRKGKAMPSKSAVEAQAGEHLDRAAPGTEKASKRQRVVSSSSAASEKAAAEPTAAAEEYCVKDNTVCMRCEEVTDQDRMLMCDVCDSAWHLMCVIPVLEAMPAGGWICEKCRDGDSNKSSFKPAGSSSGDEARASAGKRQGVGVAAAGKADAAEGVSDGGVKESESARTDAEVALLVVATMAMAQQTASAHEEPAAPPTHEEPAAPPAHEEPAAPPAHEEPAAPPAHEESAAPDAEAASSSQPQTASLPRAETSSLPPHAQASSSSRAQSSSSSSQARASTPPSSHTSASEPQRSASGTASGALQAAPSQASAQTPAPASSANVDGQDVGQDDGLLGGSKGREIKEVIGTKPSYAAFFKAILQDAGAPEPMIVPVRVALAAGAEGGSSSCSSGPKLMAVHVDCADCIDQRPCVLHGTGKLFVKEAKDQGKYRRLALAEKRRKENEERAAMGLPPLEAPMGEAPIRAAKKAKGVVGENQLVANKKPRSSKKKAPATAEAAEGAGQAPGGAAVVEPERVVVTAIMTPVDGVISAPVDGVVSVEARDIVLEGVLGVDYVYYDPPCKVCGSSEDPDTTLLCDGCNDPFHLRCVNLDAVPEGDWLCQKCIKKAAKKEALRLKKESAKEEARLAKEAAKEEARKTKEAKKAREEAKLARAAAKAEQAAMALVAEKARQDAGAIVVEDEEGEGGGMGLFLASMIPDSWATGTMMDAECGGRPSGGGGPGSKPKKERKKQVKKMFIPPPSKKREAVRERREVEMGEGEEQGGDAYDAPEDDETMLMSDEEGSSDEEHEDFPKPKRFRGKGKVNKGKKSKTKGKLRGQGVKGSGRQPYLLKDSETPRLDSSRRIACVRAKCAFFLPRLVPGEAAGLQGGGTRCILGLASDVVVSVWAVKLVAGEEEAQLLGMVMPRGCKGVACACMVGCSEGPFGVAVAGGDGRVGIWEYAGGKLNGADAAVCGAGGARVTSMQALGGGGLVFAKAGQVWAWRGDAAELIGEVGEGGITGLSVAGGGGHVYATTAKGDVSVWTLGSGQEVEGVWRGRTGDGGCMGVAASYHGLYGAFFSRRRAGMFVVGEDDDMNQESRSFRMLGLLRLVRAKDPLGGVFSQLREGTLAMLKADCAPDVKRRIRARGTPLWWWDLHRELSRRYDDASRGALIEEAKAALSSTVVALGPLGGHLLAMLSQSGEAWAVGMLLVMGAGMGEARKGGQTALSMAAIGGNADTVRLLVANKADLEVKDGDGLTALDWSRIMQKIEVAEILTAALSG